MEDWNKRNRPIRLEKRFEFENYQDTRDFLDKLGEHCEKENRFPDVSFGKTYVNLTIRPEDEEASDFNEKDYSFAKEILLLHL